MAGVHSNVGELRKGAPNPPDLARERRARRESALGGDSRAGTQRGRPRSGEPQSRAAARSARDDSSTTSASRSTSASSRVVPARVSQRLGVRTCKTRPRGTRSRSPGSPSGDLVRVLSGSWRGAECQGDLDAAVDRDEPQVCTSRTRVTGERRRGTRSRRAPRIGGLDVDDESLSEARAGQPPRPRRRGSSPGHRRAGRRRSRRRRMPDRGLAHAQPANRRMAQPAIAARAASPRRMARGPSDVDVAPHHRAAAAKRGRDEERRERTPSPTLPGDDQAQQPPSTREVASEWTAFAASAGLPYSRAARNETVIRLSRWRSRSPDDAERVPKRVARGCAKRRARRGRGTKTVIMLTARAAPPPQGPRCSPWPCPYGLRRSAGGRRPTAKSVRSAATRSVPSAPPPNQPRLRSRSPVPSFSARAHRRRIRKQAQCAAAGSSAKAYEVRYA